MQKHHELCAHCGLCHNAHCVNFVAACQEWLAAAAPEQQEEYQQSLVPKCEHKLCYDCGKCHRPDCKEFVEACQRWFEEATPQQLGLYIRRLHKKYEPEEKERSAREFEAIMNDPQKMQEWLDDLGNVDAIF